MRSNRTRRHARRPVTRFCLEKLEDRCVPSGYTLTALGSLGYATDINDAGQVVGYTTNGSQTHAFLWQNGVLTDLGTLGGQNSHGFAINNAGRVVGDAQSPTSSWNYRAVAWQGGAVTDLLPAYAASSASGINDAGQVVGRFNGGHAFLQDGGTFIDLGSLTGGPFGAASPGDINGAAQVVGSSYAGEHEDLGSVQHAFLWQDGVMTDLGLLPDFHESFASRINTSGQAVGWSTRVDMSSYEVFTRAFIYADGQMTDLGIPSVHSSALGLNDSGQVVGWMRGGGGFDPDRAFLYDDGVVTDLNTVIPAGSGVTLYSATAINDDGQIVARGRDASGVFRAYLLTPAPAGTPSVSIGDATVTEGNTGTRVATFTVTLSAASSQAIAVTYNTSSGTATAGGDYQGGGGSITFAPGETVRTIAVPVIGDRVGETNETFGVNLGQPANAIVIDGQGTGTIVDDEARIRIGDVSMQERHSGTTTFAFTVTLSATYDAPVTVRYATANGTGRSTEDYNAASGTITFAPGETSKTIFVVVRGDRKKESNETFFVNLSNAVAALIVDGQGLGTILNDD